jgi:hypothetical protein
MRKVIIQAGKHYRLRNGLKCYIYEVLGDKIFGRFFIAGVWYGIRWNLRGYYCEYPKKGTKNNYDIISVWEDECSAK